MLMETYVLISFISFRDLGPWSFGPVAFEPVERQHIVAGGHGQGNYTPCGRQEAKREKQVAGSPNPLQVFCHLSDLPSFHYFPTFEVSATC